MAKSIDRFARAIGLVLNLIHDPTEPATKDPKMRSFTFSPIDEVGRKLKVAGVEFEFGEFLKGETHYVVVMGKR